MTTRIGLIGAGVMGFAIGSRLLEKGFELSVYDRNDHKIQALVQKGAIACGSAREVGAQAYVIITSLNSAHSVGTVVFGENGIVEGASKGCLIIDMSSIDPQSTRQFSQKAIDNGLRWVDAPLSGGAPKALIGQLTLMVGGADKDVRHAGDVLKHVASNYTHMGPSGAGQTTKLINQVLCGLGFMAVAEATRLAQDAGVDAEKIPHALKVGRADSAILQEYMPRFATKDYRRTGRIDNMVKDLNAVQDLARQTNTSMPLTAACTEIHKLLTAAGLGGEDQAVLMEYFEGPGTKPSGS